MAMEVVKKILIPACCFLFLLCSSDCAKTGIAHLKRNVNFLLDSMLEFRQELRLLQDAVNSLQIQGIFSEAKSSDGIYLNLENQSNTTEIQAIITSLTEVFDLKMLAIRKGFLDEKSNIRRTLNQSFKPVTRRVNSIAKVTSDKISALQEQVAGGLTEMNHTLNEGLDVLTDRVIGLSSRVDSVEMNGQVVKELISAARSNEERTKKQRTLMELDFENEEYKRHGNSIYKVFSIWIPWSEADQFCRILNGHLVEVRDRDEYNFVRTLAGDYYVWFGATDIDREGTWRWSSSGSPVDDWLWRPGEPNNTNDAEDCSAGDGIYSGGPGLNDVPCSDDTAFICEWEI